MISTIKFSIIILMKLIKIGYKFKMEKNLSDKVRIWTKNPNLLSFIMLLIDNKILKIKAFNVT
jgi:hypothetical protein